MHQGILIVVSGPSGAGKGTICQSLLAKNSNIAYSVSATTRAPRTGEVDGVNYIFMQKEDFEKKIEYNGFLEYAKVYDNYYGTPRDYVMGQLEQGKDIILEIDPQGAMQVKEHCPDGVFIYIVPPSLEELSRRIYGRGTDAEDVIKKRLAAATEEIAYATKYDYIVVNDEVEQATSKVESIIAAEHLRAGRTYFILEQICPQGEE